VTDIQVTRTGETDESLTFDVHVSESGSRSRHVVTLARSDVDAQGDRFPQPEDFVRRCMEYLLEREPKESILERFNVRDIGRYFPEFTRDLLHPED
jgi:hypothetical protein